MKTTWLPGSRNWCLAILLLLSLTTGAQNKDSLLQVIPTVTNEADRIRLMYLIMDGSGSNDPKEALFYYKKLLQLTRQLNDKAAEAVATAELGYAIAYTGNTATGSELVYKALQMAEEAGSQQAIGIAYDNIGLVYQGDPFKNRDYFLKALAASTAAKDYTFMCWALGNLSNLYISGGIGNLDSALYFNQRSIELARANTLENSIPMCLVQAGTIQYRLGQKGLALEYYRAAMNEPYIAKDAKTAGAVYRSLAKFFLSEGRLDSALYYAQVNREAVKNAFYSLQMPAAQTLWKVYEKINSDSALKYATQFYAMKDSMFSQGQVQQMQTNALMEEDRQQKLSEERKHNLQHAAIALGIIVLLIGFLAFSHSVLANQKFIRFLGIVSLLIVFEFLNLLLHPSLGELTHHSPVLMLFIMVSMAALLVPLHHKLEHWITHRMVEKNNNIRLTAAKRTIQQLEGFGVEQKH